LPRFAICSRKAAKIVNFNNFPEYFQQTRNGVKKIMRHLLKLLVIFTVISVAYSGFAQERQGAFYISPFIGGYTFEGNQDLNTRPVYGLRGGYNFTKNIAAELVFGYDSTKYAPAAVDVDAKAYNYRLEGIYNFMPDKKLVPFVAIGVGGQSLRYDDGVLGTNIDRNRIVGDYGAGLKYHFTDLIALRADVRHVLAFGSTYNNLVYTLGIVFSFGGKKESRVVAQAPEQAPVALIAAPINLAAAAVSESQINLAWNSVAGATGYKIYRDGTYVTSSPAAALPDKGLNADTRYCYTVTAFDQTNKESDPSNTACAKTPAPPVVETMKKEAESATAAVAKEMIEKGRATINVEFDTNKAKIKTKYHQEIEKFALVMKDYPELKVIIEGHTDTVGGKNFNQKLSERRANSVKNYMVKNFGIDESRLTAKGYGLSKPIASNKDAAGRQKNRRVEAVVDYTVKK
jgi:OmpA-OmpF porin, OOP family